MSSLAWLDRETQRSLQASALEFPGTPIAAPIRDHDLYPDLPKGLIVERVGDRGRGIVANKTFQPGQTLMKSCPIVSVLNNHNIAKRCSRCFKSNQDLKTILESSYSGRKQKEKEGENKVKELQRCARCHIIHYCSPVCQRLDWPLHKFECKRLCQQYEGKERKVGQTRFIPDTPVRCLARLIWKNWIQSEGQGFWDQIEQLESHRYGPKTRLSTEQQQTIVRFADALVAYIGDQEILNKSTPSGQAMIDLFSRFTSNSFSLTSPADLTEIGVSISTLTFSMLNHSCQPNAVVVYPQFASSSTITSTSNTESEKIMSLAAIRKIEPGEEVRISYVDIAMRREERQKELGERYKFRCGCRECTRYDTKEDDDDDDGGRIVVDPREAFLCGTFGCDGLRAMKKGGGLSKCSDCYTTVNVPDVSKELEAARLVLIEAEKTQWSTSMTELAKCIKSLSNTTERLTPQYIKWPLAPSTYPLFQCTTLLSTLLIDSTLFDRALMPTAWSLKGYKRIYDWGHPVLAMANYTRTKLDSVFGDGVSQKRSQWQEMMYWKSTSDRLYDINKLVETLKEVENAFGKKEGGGFVGDVIRGSIRDLEEGMEMAKRV